MYDYYTAKIGIINAKDFSLENVRNVRTGVLYRDHMWLRYSAFWEPYNLREGATIIVHAKPHSYFHKGKRKKSLCNFGDITVCN